MNMPYKDMENAARVQFQHLKYILQCIEKTGKRPIVITDGNGMLDSLRIADAHPSTPEVDRIRAEKKGAVPQAA